MNKDKNNWASSFFIITLVVGFFTWASIFKVDENVRATGHVVTNDRTQVIQVADGGVLKKLNILEGDKVRKGDTLAMLENTRAEAERDSILAEIANLKIARSRASAESKDVEPNFSEFIDRYPDAVAAQKELFNSNKAALESRVRSANQIYESTKVELDSLQELEKSGDASSAEASALRREVNQLDSDRKKIRDDFRILSLREVSDLEMKLASSLFILKEKQDVLDHTFIKSPLDGTINQLNVNTVGGVLRPGDELLRISPANNRYFVEIQIRPSDVGALKSGLTASVKFDAYDSSIYGSLKGVLNYVSAEPIFSQSANGQSSSYYVGRITLLEDQTNRRLSKNILRPGLSTVIDIKTGERSVLTFLLKPIIKSFSGALEQR